MSTRVYLIRHGETDWNAEHRAQGHTDVELNEVGRRQAAALAQALQDAPLRAVYSSPLKRALETAQMVAASHGLPVETQQDLKELDQGELEGLVPEEMRRRHGEVLRRWNAGDTSVRLPGGESMEQVQERAWAAVWGICARHPEQTVAIIGHNLANLAIICRAVGVQLSAFRRLRQATGSLSVLEVGPERSTLLRFNDICHHQGSNRP
ncbi:MAG: histidine phosphatase family protein [Chloroflexi bacterium]|nr:histidine phosphatase family protein [Chloroflexota bacterium]